MYEWVIEEINSLGCGECDEQAHKCLGEGAEVLYKSTNNGMVLMLVWHRNVSHCLV